MRVASYSKAVRPSARPGSVRRRDRDRDRVAQLEAGNSSRLSSRSPPRSPRAPSESSASHIPGHCRRPQGGALGRGVGSLTSTLTPTATSLPANLVVCSAHGCEASGGRFRPIRHRQVSQNRARRSPVSIDPARSVRCELDMYTASATWPFYSVTISKSTRSRIRSARPARASTFGKLTIRYCRQRASDTEMFHVKHPEMSLWRLGPRRDGIHSTCLGGG